MNRKALQVFLTTFYMSLCATIFAQGLPCNDQLNISADVESCEVLLTPAIMSEDDAEGRIIAITGLPEGTPMNALDYDGDSLEVTIYTDLIPGFKEAGMVMVQVHVIESATGNSCWGDVMLEYKMPALLVGPDDVTVSCLDPGVYTTNPDNAIQENGYIDIVIGNPTLNNTGTVTWDQNTCVYGTITFEDREETERCGPTDDVRVTKIERIFTVTTPKGKISQYTQYITVDNVSGQVKGPQSPIIIDCTVTDMSPASIVSIYSGVDTAGYPYVDVGNGEYEILKNGEAKCNVVSTYDDGSLIKACAACAAGQGTVKFVRTWTILDWCTGEVIYRTQAIKKIDDEGPEIETDEYVIAHTTAWACGQDIDIWATANDDCDANAKIIDVVGYYHIGYTAETEGPFPDKDIIPAANFIKISDGHYTIKEAQVGHTWIKWIASDCCGNLSYAYSLVTVIDETPPVAIAKQNLVIALTTSGLDEDDPHYSGPGAAKLYAYQVDNGSYDNCTDVRLEIRREHDAPRCSNFGLEYYNGTEYDYWNNNITYDAEYDGEEGEHPGPPDAQNGLDLEDSQYDTDEGKFVKFCCEDVGSEHKVWLRVWDEAFTNNYNETWAYVKVEDKNVPQLEGYDDEIYCYDDWAWIYNDQEWTSIGSGKTQYFPEPTDSHSGITAPYITNTLCGAYILQHKDSDLDLNSCNVGEWTRTYRLLNLDSSVVMDRSWNPVEWEQTVAVHPSNSDIHFHWPYLDYGLNHRGWDKYGADDQSYYHLPAEIYHWEDCTLTEDDVIKPDVTGIVCDVLGRKITIEEYEVGQGQGCKKWYVTYDYINWCYDCADSSMKSKSEPSGATTEEGRKNYIGEYGHVERCLSDGLYHVAKFSTIYKFEDTEGPTVTGDSGAGQIDATCETSITLNPTAEDNIECNLDLRWTVTVTNKDDDVTDEYRKVLKSTGAAPSFTFGDLLPGDYEVLYEVLDACDNLGKDVGTIWIEGKAPTPYCISLHSAVMVDGSVTLWANDFDKGSFTNCGDNAIATTFNEADNAPAHPNIELLGKNHYFHGLGLIYDDVKDYNISNDAVGKAAFEAGEAQLWLAEDLTSGYYFSCKNGLDISAPIPVGMRVWDLGFFLNEKVDRVFYSDFCSVSLSLIDNQSACGETPLGGTVMGSVRTSSGAGVNNVKAELSAELPEFPKYANTINGTYSFTDLPKGVEFVVTASRDDAFDNGASTLDLVLIQRHILGMAKLDSEYKMIAADINNDEDIKASDLVELRKVVLGVKDNFTNDSWRFVAEDQTFADPTHPFPFAEAVDVFANETANFVAVKIGDVNGDAAVNADSEVVKPRSANTVTFVAADRAVQAGELVEVAITAENFNEVFGYQFTASLNGLTVEGVTAGAIDMASENIGTPSANTMTMSWTKANGASISANEVLFTLNLRADNAGQLSSMINMNSSVTAAEAYTTENLEYANTELEVRGEVAGEFALYQNEPNPFKDVTVISFNLPTAANASLKVFDVTGKVLMSKTIAANKGLNTENVQSSDINSATGVLYYQVESGEFTATKKMIILE